MAAETSATAAHPRVAKAGPPPRYLGGTPRGRGPTPRVSVPAPGRANWQSDAGNLFLPRRFLGGHPPRRLSEPAAATAARSKTTSCVIAGRSGRGSTRWKWGGAPQRRLRRGKPPQRRRRGPKPKISQTTMSPSRTRKRSSDVWKRGDLCTSARKSDPAKDSWGREHLHAARPPRLPCQVYEGKGKRKV